MKLLKPTIIIFLLLSACYYKDPPKEVATAYLNDSLIEEIESSIYEKQNFNCDLLQNMPPNDTPIIFCEGRVSIGKEKGAITFSPDGKEFWFGRAYPYEIYFMKKVDGKWQGPMLASFSGKNKDLYPYLSPDGRKLIFTSDRQLKKKTSKTKNEQSLNLWESRRMQSGWTNPRNIGSSVNFGMFNICPTISAKGTLFYNLGNSTKDSSYLDIYESKYIYNKYAKPRCMELSINSASLDFSPFIAPDESYIIFASKRYGYGNSDLFISYKKNSGSWTEAINMGPQINSKDDESFPSVSPDRKYLFFNSNRATKVDFSTSLNKPSYIYWVSADIIEKLKPANIKKIKNEKGKSL